MTNRFDTADDWVDGDVLDAADLIDTFARIQWSGMLDVDTSNGGTSYDDVIGVVGYAADTLSIVNAANILTSTNGGTSWTSKNTDLDASTILTRGCKATRTSAFFLETGTTCESAHTSDSGATVTTKTSASFGTSVADMSYPTTGLIVVGGDDGGGGNHIIYSTDSGGTWTDASTQPSAAIILVDMFDGTNGVAVDTSGNIWKTTDSADTWTDTTLNVGTSSNQQIVMLSTTTFFFIGFPTNNVATVQYGDLSTPYITGSLFAIANYTTTPSIRFHRAANNNFYVLLAGAGQTDNSTLWRTADGVTWFSKVLPFASTAAAKSGLIGEMGDNELILLTGTTSSNRATVFRIKDD